MGIDIQLIKILLFAFPGIVGFFTYSIIIGRKDEKEKEDFLLIFIFSIVPYILIECFGGGGVFDEWFGVSNTEVPSPILNGRLIVLATLIGATLGVFTALVHEKRWLYKLACIAKITKRVGYQDTWDIFQDESEGWYCVRDHKLGLVYTGYFHRYSQNSTLKELVIRDVDVYADEGDHLYKTSEMYICRQPDDLTIEALRKENNNAETTADNE